MDKFLPPGTRVKIHATGEILTVVKWEAAWSLTRDLPHTLWILFEGERKFRRFTSDASKCCFPDFDLA
jgi:hypothetical protein